MPEEARAGELQGLLHAVEDLDVVDDVIQAVDDPEELRSPRYEGSDASMILR